MSTGCLLDARILCFAVGGVGMPSKAAYISEWSAIQNGVMYSRNNGIRAPIRGICDDFKASFSVRLIPSRE